jgi:hypothetical protein
MEVTYSLQATLLRQWQSQNQQALYRNFTKYIMCFLDIYRFYLGKILLLSTASKTALEPTQSPIQWEMGADSLTVKWPGREADHSPPSTSEVKNNAAIPAVHHVS